VAGVGNGLCVVSADGTDTGDGAPAGGDAGAGESGGFVLGGQSEAVGRAVGGGAPPLLLHSHVCRPPSPPSTSAHVCKCDMKMCVRVRRVQAYVVHTPHKGTNMAGEGP
jgi:hypothetical protein